MTPIIAVLSKIPRLSYHLRAKLPNLTVCDVLSDTEEKDVPSKLRTAEILVADCDLLIPYLNDLSSVKWVQSTWAGVDKLIPHLKGKEVPFTLSRFSGRSFGLAMSEYVIAQMVNHERDQRRQYDDQGSSTWTTDGRISNHRLICDLTVAILGLGTIGKSIAQNLKSLGATVWGMTRTSPKERLDYVDVCKTRDSMSNILENCDYMINVLPTTPDTVGLLGGRALEVCKNRRPVFINIGRGTIIKEADLINALEEKWISAAILDVFEKEPLPKESKLWSMPQVTISPHISGVTRPQDVADEFAKSYVKFTKGESIPNTFDPSRGY